jgi:hypothetical protein
MASKSSSVPGYTGGSDQDLTRSPKTKINRVRTGCFTCRKRRKKCDEARPACKACVKTNILCEGYPPRTLWGTRAPGRRTAKSKSTADSGGLCRNGETLADVRTTSLNLIPVQLSATYDEETLNNGEMAKWFNEPVSPRFPLICYDQNSVNIEGGQADDEYDLLFPQFSDPLAFEESFGSPTQSMSMFSPQQSNNRNLVLSGNGGFESILSPNGVRPGCVPPELPFLIAGVESKVHRRLFYHFTHVMSKVLTTFGDDSNPMNEIMIPLALGDRTLLHSLLALACSHLLKLQRSEINPELSAEKNQLHKEVVNTQTHRVQALKQSSTGTGSQFSSRDRDGLLATSLMLCLYEICEGTGDDSWRMHLDMAREILSITPIATMMNPFLLEFFLYHDSLAMVTVPSTAPRFKCTANLSDQHSCMVGVQDGLTEYVTRISSLRSEAGSGSFPPNYDILNKALAIWEDLSRWKPKVTLCKERKLIAQFYQWALFIWLFSIIYPDGKSDAVVQSAVQWMITGMSEIKSGDGVMACLLFPLFVVGSAAIRQEDRNTVTKHFKRVRAWSSLGNVDLTYKVVEKMWKDHDEGMPRSWDWVMQLERAGTSLLVT